MHYLYSTISFQIPTFITSKNPGMRLNMLTTRLNLNLYFGRSVTQPDLYVPNITDIKLCGAIAI